MQVPQDSNIRLSDLIHQLLYNSYNELKQLSISLKSKRDEERKLLLLKYFKKLRIQFVRLLVLVNWKVEKPTLDKSIKLLELLEQQDETFTNTSDQLYWLQHSYLKEKNCDKIPIYDIPTSIDILQSGAPRQLPLSLGNPHEVIDLKINDKNVDIQSSKKIQSELEEIIMIKLLWENLPSQCVSSSVENGQLILEDKNEFRVALTISEEKNGNYLWNILDINIYILTNSVPELAAANKENYLRQAQEIIDNSSKPLLDLYVFLRTLCQSIQLDILHTQLQYIKKAYNNRFAIITNVQYEEGERLKVNLWYSSEDERNIHILIYPTPPMECFIDDDESSRLTVEHYPPLVDTSHNPVTLKLNSKKISIENLILASTKYYCYNQLKYIYNSILNDAKANKIVVDDKSLNFIITPDDIMFVVKEDLSHSAIMIRMFDSLNISLVMSQRDGTIKIKDIPKEIKVNIKNIDEYPNMFNFLLNVQLEIVKYGVTKILESHQVDFISKGLPQEMIKRFINHDVLYLKTSSLNTIHRNIAITFKIITNNDYQLKPSGYVNMKMYHLNNNIPNEIPLHSSFTSITYNDGEKNKPTVMNDVHSDFKLNSKRQKLKDMDEELSYVHIGQNFRLSKSSQYYQLFTNILMRFKNNSKILVFIDILDSQDNFTCIRKDEIGDIPFKYVCEFKNKDVKIETAIVFHPSHWCAMIGMENGIEYPVISKIYDNRVIYYDMNSNTWIFKYIDYDPKNIYTFENDLLTLTETLYSLYKLRTYLLNNSNLNNFFQLDHLTYSSICLRYGMQKECTITFSFCNSDMYPGDACVSFYPYDSYFKRIVACDFKMKKSIPKILNMVWNTHMLEKYLRIELEKIPNKKGLISFIPQTLSYAKLVVDTVFQIEFRFVGNRVITMNIMHSQKSYLASINTLFISSSLREIQDNNEQKYYLDDSITNERLFLTESMIGFSDVFFPPLLKRIFNEMMKFFK